MLSSLYEVIYYVYILFIGAYISIKVACGTAAGKEWKVWCLICPVMLILQGICLQLWGVGLVWRIYPVIVHIPMMLAMILLLRVRGDVALVSIAISYSLCQLFRWIGLITDLLNLLPVVSLAIHLALCQLLLLLLNRRCLGPMHDVIGQSVSIRMCFGALPILYYLYEYFMMYTRDRYTHVMALNELLPTAMVFFSVLFVIAYQREMEKRKQLEQQAAALDTALSQAGYELTHLRAVKEQTAIYRHDLRHHLMMINGLLATGETEQAAAYIGKAVDEIETIVPVRFCDNETINLLLSAFKKKADSEGIAMSVKAALKQKLNLPETELCAILSNALENALHAVLALPAQTTGWIDIFCGEKQNNLLIEIKNAYHGEVVMQNGLPVAKGNERRYGCRSIQSIVLRRKGVCTFDAADGVFVLRIAIPLSNADEG